MIPTVLLLAGCATAAEPPQARHCDYQGASGICVHVDPNARRLDPAQLEAAYLQAKLDISARYQLDLTDVPGPNVRVMHIADFAQLHPIQNRLDGDLGGDHGWTGFATGEIRITGPDVMRHEAMHYLLWKTGYSNRLNALHEHPAFDEYRDGNWLPKRAVAAAPTSQQSHADSDSLLPGSPATTTR